MAWNDPILQEVRMAREKLWKECNYDLNELCDRLKKNQAAHGAQIVTKKNLSPRVTNKSGSVRS